MGDQPFRIRYAPHAGDESWARDWTPHLLFDREKTPVAWEDLPEGELGYLRFLVDVTFVVGDVDFSRTYLPILDFAPAWASAPAQLKTADRVVVDMTMEALDYLVEKDGDQVQISANLIPGQVALPHATFEAMVDEIVDRAFAMLFDTHPRLRGNHYLIDLLRRLAALKPPQ